jgi:peptide/nickel transport system substrate-binding protein
MGLRSTAVRGGSRLLTAVVAAGLIVGASGAALAQDPETTFTYASHLAVVTDLDPATSYSNEVIAMHDIYESLTRYDSATGTVKPALAESWTTSPDGLTWTFKLRDGVTFHTGRTMDATAAKEAIERTKALGQGAGYIWGPVTAIEAPDASTLVFTLEYPAPLDLIASAQYASYIYDTHAAGEGKTEEDLVAFFKAAGDAGTGPYRIDSWEPGQEFELTLNKNPSYWAGWEGDHYTQVVYRVVPEATTAAQLVQSGEVQIADRLTPQLVDSLRNDDRVQITETPSFQNLVMLLNTASGPLADPKVRAAVAKAVDTQGIATALAGGVVPTKGVIPPGLLGHSDTLTGTGLDLEGAKALLEGTGYGPTGERLKLSATIATGDTDLQLVATSLKSNLDQLNIDLQVDATEWQAQWDRAKSADPAARQDIFLMYWWPDYPDPISWFQSLFHSEAEPNFNLAYYANPEMDAAIDGIQSLTATDRAAADAAYVKMQQQLIDDAVVVAPYVQSYQRVLDSTVGGYVDDPAYAQVVFAYDLTPGA